MDRIRLGQLPVDRLDMSGALDAIDELVRSGRGGTVFTPNVDHVVIAEHDPRFRDAYSRVDLSLVDGMPLLWVARLLRTPLPEKVSGSDLVEPLMQRAALRKFRVYMLGGAAGVSERAARKLAERNPGLEIVGIDAPNVSLDQDPAERAAILKRINDARPDIVLVALGGHKQEIFCDQCVDALRPAVLVCIGAALNFVAGTERRAPRWVSRLGFEWLYRLLQDPKRLAARYLGRDPEFFRIVARQLSAGAQKSTA